MSDIVIKAENLGKKYTIGHQAERGGYKALRDVLMQNARTLWNKTKDLATGKPIVHGDTLEEVWALKDVSFEVSRGEAVGIIGRNGAGKSTLLKILSRITEPTTGRVTIKDRVASLLEVGTGFHSELTGRENIYLNGTILGMTRKEIKCKFDKIVDFAEIEKYLDTPVKRYSSGMYVRLAFAVAAHLEPEILVVDEVLAVGDAEFQKKCLSKMGDVAKEGRTVLFVSHNMGAILTLTRKCASLDNGALVFWGDTHEAVEQYLSSSMSGPDGKTYDLNFYRPGYVVKANKGEERVRYTDVWMEHDKKKTTTIDMGDEFEICFELDVRSEIKGANLSLGILNSGGQFVAVVFSLDKNFSIYLRPGKHIIRLVVQDLVLTPGKYYVGSGINQSSETTPWDVISNLPLFEVRNSGKVVHWLHRPWGAVHCDNVQWLQER